MQITAGRYRDKFPKPVPSKIEQPMTLPSSELRSTLERLRRNRFFRAALTGLKVLTLALFGICIVSFLSALTQIFTIGDVYIEALMRWAFVLLLGTIALLMGIALYELIYNYSKTILQRNKRAKLDRSVR